MKTKTCSFMLVGAIHKLCHMNFMIFLLQVFLVIALDTPVRLPAPYCNIKYFSILQINIFKLKHQFRN